MSIYQVVAAIWQDHTVFRNSELPKSIDGLITPSLTLGILYQDEKDHIVIASHIERYEDTDQCDYTVIFKSALLGLKKYGSIEIEDLRNKEG